MMTWEETIRFIRTKPEYKDLVEQSYLEDDLKSNVYRFRTSEEFTETKRYIREFAPQAISILDIGAGNGISSVAFALSGLEVTVVEPDPSITVGCGAIEILKKEFDLNKLIIKNSYGERLPFENAIFDIVYARQAMHHASELNAFIMEAGRVLKPGGLLLTIRDHVIFSDRDKQDFLLTHPLQRFYGGENAFTADQYISAIRNAGFQIRKHLKYYDSVINYFPVKATDVSNTGKLMRENFRQSLRKRFGSWVVNFPFLQLLELISCLKNGDWTDERRIPGRMNSFIAIKNTL